MPPPPQCLYDNFLRFLQYASSSSFHTDTSAQIEYFLSLVTRCTNKDTNKKLFSILIFLCFRGATPAPGNSIIVTLYNSHELNTEQKEKKQDTLNASENKIQLIESIIKRTRSCTAADYVVGTYWQTKTCQLVLYGEALTITTTPAPPAIKHPPATHSVSPHFHQKRCEI